MKKKSDNKNRDVRPQEAIGTSRVKAIVQGRAKHGWQEYDSLNDNGVDGIIIKRKRGIDTGEIVYAQVKCGTGSGYYKATKSRPRHFGVQLGKKYISTHRPRWNNLIGSIILIYVDYDTEKAWWVDLKDDKSYTPDNKSVILIPKNQRFGIHSFGEFKNLKGYLHVSTKIKTILAEKNDFRYFNFTNSSIKSWAKSFYKSWADSSERFHPKLGEIIVSREGWRHITRTGRKPERIFQSWSLLGIAKKIIQEVDEIYQLRYERSDLDDSGNYVINDYIALRAEVVFSFRHSSIVQVILKRTRKFNSTNYKTENKIRFHSIYEPFNGKNLR